jgi:hypothetical protein
MFPLAAMLANGSEAEAPMPDGHALLRVAAAELARAVLDLAALRGGPGPADGPLDEATGVWTDREYMYVEVRLPHDIGSCVDISTCGRTLMVRIARHESDGL